MQPWAEQGNFRFIRIDGGQIESWKAERTWWGGKFSAEEKGHDVWAQPVAPIRNQPFR
ncbi:MAG TPA: hypothetical protein VMI10_00470 [Terriglobales bacterium]|nr:hypothetical protein [Terriglobales bacterium]